MRRAFVLVAILAAVLVGAAGSSASSVQPVTCGSTTCLGGGGCGQAYNQSNVSPFPGDWYKVWLGVQFCSDGHSITWSNPYTYGCQNGGSYSCGSTNGPFRIAGGAGQWSVTWQFSANLHYGLPFPLGLNTAKTITCTVYADLNWSC